MNRLHNTFFPVIKDQKHLIFWGEATKRYSQLLDKYHMELSTANPKNFRFESSLTEEACNGLMELGLLVNVIRNFIGYGFDKSWSIKFYTLKNKEICVKTIDKSSKPVFLRRKNEEKFFLRKGNSTTPLSISEAVMYINQNFLE